MDTQRLQELAGMQINEEEDEAAEVKQTSQFRKALDSNNVNGARRLASDFGWDMNEIADQLKDWFVYSK